MPIACTSEVVLVTQALERAILEGPEESLQLWGSGKLSLRLRVCVVGVVVGISAACAAGWPALFVIIVECAGLGRLVPLFSPVLWVPVAVEGGPLGRV